jgi:capsular polysaccharide transport system permease protein
VVLGEAVSQSSEAMTNVRNALSKSGTNEESAGTGVTPATGLRGSILSAFQSGSSLPAPGNGPYQTIRQAGEARSRRKYWIWGIVVGLPTLIASIYYGLIASDRYVSSAQVVVSAEGEGANSVLSSLLSGIGGMGGGADVASQGQVLAALIQSSEMLSRVEAVVDFKAMYARSKADFFSSLKPDAKFEDRLKYFNSMVSVDWDGHSRIVSIDVRAFTPQDAKALLDAIISISEERLNDVEKRQQDDTMAFARAELTRAETHLTDVSTKVSDFRRQNGEIDPEGTAELSGQLIANLNAKIADDQTDLAKLLTYVKPDNSQIKGLRSQIEQLQKEVQHQEVLRTGLIKGALSDKVSQYESLLFDEDFAREAYKTALTFMESARANALEQHSYVIDFVSARTPEKSTEPHRMQSVLIVLVGSIILLAIGNLIVVSIREQANV